MWSVSGAVSVKKALSWRWCRRRRRPRPDAPRRRCRRARCRPGRSRRRPARRSARAARSRRRCCAGSGRRASAHRSRTACAVAAGSRAAGLPPRARDPGRAGAEPGLHALAGPGISKALYLRRSNSGKCLRKLDASRRERSVYASRDARRRSRAPGRARRAAARHAAPRACSRAARIAGSDLGLGGTRRHSAAVRSSPPPGGVARAGVANAPEIQGDEDEPSPRSSRASRAIN